MYYGLLKLEFEEDESNARDLRELRSLCVRVRSRYKVVAQFEYMKTKSHLTYMKLNVAYLNADRQNIESIFEKIGNFCEDIGFARVASEDRRIERVEKILS